MTTDHVGPQSGIARDHYYFPGDASGFGLGFAVRTLLPASPAADRANIAGTVSPARSFWSIRKDDMFVDLHGPDAVAAADQDSKLALKIADLSRRLRQR